MDGDSGSNEDKGFQFQLHMKAERKAREYTALLQDRQRLEKNIELVKAHVTLLNNLLETEGLAPVPLRAAPHLASIVGKPGNRTKGFPIRQVQWEGLSINRIIVSILSASPGVSFHPTAVAEKVYEIQTETDAKAVKRNMRAAMQKGAREGLWERTGRAKFSANTTEEQGKLGG